MASLTLKEEQAKQVSSYKKLAIIALEDYNDKHPPHLSAYSAKLCYIPNDDELELAFAKGIIMSLQYSKRYKVGIKNIDVFKLFTFATIALCQNCQNLQISSKENAFNSAPIWMSLIDEIEHKYNASFSQASRKLFKKSVKVLEKLSKNKNDCIAAYTYIKGIEEAVI